MKTNRLSLILMALCSFAYSSQETYWDDGSSLGSNILSQYKGNMDKRVNNPISKGQKLYTLDNSQSGDASITCSKETSILKIGYSNNGGGDISINVNEDLDLDGSYEKSFGVSGVSGVCANGFIKCDSGTWNNCNFYQLSFNGDNFSYEKVDNQNLAQCYCINSSCGNLSSNEKAKVLSDLGGTFASLIRNGYYVVSNVSTNSDYAEVFGKSVNCGGKKAPIGMDSSAIQAKTEEIKAKDVNDKNSTYYVLNQTTENVNNNPVDNTFKQNLIKKDNSVKNSSKWDKTTKNYSYSDDGQKIDGSIFVKDFKKTQYCEVGYSSISPDVFGDGKNRQNATSSDKVQKTEIVECVKSGSNWICPVKNGQSVIHDCGQVNDFKKVAGAFSAINEAVKDFSCSTK